MTPAEYVALLDTRRRMRAHSRQLLEAVGADAYLTLSSSGPAIEGHEFSGSRSFLVCASWLGLPAFSLPLLEAHGLPLGVQLIGAEGDDGRLCATAAWIMQSLSC